MTGQGTHFVEELSEKDWKVLSQSVQEMEQQWRNGPSEPKLGEFLLQTQDASLKKRILIELVKSDQEIRWQRGHKKPLEDYLNEWAELNNAATVRELLEAECLTRTGLGEPPQPAELEQRFPGVGDSVDLALIADQAESEDLPLDQILPRLPETPEFLGRYKIIKRLGRGGMGEIYLAHDDQLDREVAVKIPQIDPQREPRLAAQFVQEAKAAATIRHENFCVIFDVGTEDERPYLVMEFIDGKSLEERLSKGPLSPNEAVAIVSKLAEALDSFHREGLIHRDVKPSNVMMKGNGEPVLMDFGLAQETQTETGATIPESLKGTPAYIAPEILNEREHRPDVRSDVYSLGVLLYHALAGVPPFRGQLTEVLRDVAEQDPAPLRSIQSSLDPALEQICQRAMAKAPGDRFQSAADLSFTLKLWSESPKDSRWLQALAIISGAASIILLGLLVWVIRTKPEPLEQNAAPVHTGGTLARSNQVGPAPEKTEHKHHVAGDPVPSPGKSEPGGEFENAWILPLDEQNAAKFADKIDPANDWDTYLIEARQSGFMELYIQPQSSLKLRVTLLDASDDAESRGKPVGLTTSESFEGHQFCQLAREVTKGDRLYPRVESQLGKSRGDYEIKVRSLNVGKQVVPVKTPIQDSRPGPPLEASVLTKLEGTLESLQAENWPDHGTDQFRRRLIALCKTHPGRPEVRHLCRWLAELPPPEMTNGELRWVDFTLPEQQNERLRIPPQGTLIVRSVTEAGDPARLHIVEGWRPGPLAIQLVPLEDDAGGFFELNWSKGSDTFGRRTTPPYCTYHDIMGSAPQNLVNLRVSIRRHHDTLTGEYLLLLWQPEEPASRDSIDPKR